MPPWYLTNEPLSYACNRGHQSSVEMTERNVDRKGVGRMLTMVDKAAAIVRSVTSLRFIAVQVLKSYFL